MTTEERLNRLEEDLSLNKWRFRWSLGTFALIILCLVATGANFDRLDNNMEKKIIVGEVYAKKFVVINEKSYPDPLAPKATLDENGFTFYSFNGVGAKLGRGATMFETQLALFDYQMHTLRAKLVVGPSSPKSLGDALQNKSVSAPALTMYDEAEKITWSAP
jgi:hypothetical protein